MLKTLRITSLAAVILAACGVLVTALFGFKGDPEKAALLETPSVTEKFQGQPTKADKKEGDIHPLVTQAKAFALRLNPPPPPKPVTPVNPNPQPKPDTTVARPPVQKPVMPPPPVVNPSFQVLATVQYKTDPTRSLVLLKSGNTLEWFRQGEKAGHLDIDEIGDGSIVVSQGGRNPQTLFVPAKPEGKSLLKGETHVAASGPSTVTMPGAAATPASLVSGGQVPGSTSAPSTPRMLTSRVGRTRALPPPPTPAQQKEELEQTITGIQEIMNRQDDSVDDAQRQAENQMWMELLNTLKNEKESLAATAATEESAEVPAEGEGPVTPVEGEGPNASAESEGRGGPAEAPVLPEVPDPAIPEEEAEGRARPEAGVPNEY